jgi:hypothetical protein
MNTFNRLKLRKIYFSSYSSLLFYYLQLVARNFFFRPIKRFLLLEDSLSSNQRWTHNNNYTIKIKLQNLAEVERLLENKNTYVVWMQTDQIICNKHWTDY